jgi:hypothetical protein
MNQAWRELLCVLLFFAATVAMIIELLSPIEQPAANKSYYFTPLPALREVKR